MNSDVLPAANLELKSLEDLVRQIIANLSPDRQPLAYLLEKNGTNYLGTVFSIPAYYQQRGLPVFAHVILKDEGYANEDFLRFDTRKGRGKNLTFVNSIDEADLSTGYIQYVPIVKVKGDLPFVEL